MAFCPMCGSADEEGSAFCENCGAALGAPAAAPAAAPVPAAPTTPALTPAAHFAATVSRSSLSPRARFIAAIAIAAIAGIAIGLFAAYGVYRSGGGAMVAFARHYEGTWVDHETGNKGIIATDGDEATITLIGGQVYSDSSGGNGGEEVVAVIRVHDGRITFEDPSGDLDTGVSISVDDDRLVIAADGDSMVFERE
jgi:hypothetical protein